jgi:hypothetical protein
LIARKLKKYFFSVESDKIFFSTLRVNCKYLISLITI